MHKADTHYFRKGSYLLTGDSDLWVANSTSTFTQERCWEMPRQSMWNLPFPKYVPLNGETTMAVHAPNASQHLLQAPWPETTGSEPYTRANLDTPKTPDPPGASLVMNHWQERSLPAGPVCLMWAGPGEQGCGSRAGGCPRARLGNTCAAGAVRAAGLSSCLAGW